MPFQTSVSTHLPPPSRQPSSSIPPPPSPPSSASPSPFPSLPSPPPQPSLAPPSQTPASTTTTVPAARPPTCTHILAKKNRRCRMPVKQGATLCVAHSTGPRCPSCHTRLPSTTALSAHLTKPLCPVLKRERATSTQPYYRSAANLTNSKTLTSPLPLHSNLLSTDHTLLTTLATRILKLFPPASLPTIPSLHETETLRAAWSNARDSRVKLEPRHFAQGAQLASHLLTHAMPDATVIELGAGRGYTALLTAGALALRGVPAKSVVLVDRAAARHKADRTLRIWPMTNVPAPHVERVRVDLADVVLAGVTSLSTNVYIVGKHVCGAGTDLSLVAATRLLEIKNICNVRVALAPCCRRLCAYDVFGDGAVVWKEMNVGEEQVAMLCRAAMWGLDAKHASEMAKVGRMCRSAVDAVRVEWLRRQGWQVGLGTLATKESPENAVIVAEWRRGGGGDGGTENGDGAL